MKRFTVVAALLAAALLSGRAEAQTVVKAAFGSQPGHPSFIGLERFKTLVEQKTNGSVKIELYPDRQLGEEREVVEGLQIGSVDMAVVSTGPLGAFVPQVNVLDLPFMFENSAHVYRVLDGEIGHDLLKRFDSRNIVGLAWWENGWRHVTAKKAVAGPEDLKGVKLRTMQNTVHIAAFRKFGAAPIPMVWGEVFTSLGQGVIDAQENPITIIYTNSLWEVQTHVMLTGHVYSPHAVLFSKTKWSALKPDQQAAVREAAREATPFQRETSAKLETEFLERLRQKGMKVEQPDMAKFRELTQDVGTGAPGIDAATIDKIKASAKAP